MSQLKKNPVVCEPYDGPSISMVGDNYRIIIGGNQTNNSYAVIDMLVGPGGGPGPHSQRHHGNILHTGRGDRISFGSGEDNCRICTSIPPSLNLSSSFTYAQTTFSAWMPGFQKFRSAHTASRTLFATFAGEPLRYLRSEMPPILSGGNLTGAFGRSLDVFNKIHKLNAPLKPNNLTGKMLFK